MPRTNKSTGIEGVSITERKDGKNRFECKVKDPLGGYFRERHASRKDALTWAGKMLREAGRGVSAGSISIADIGPGWIKHLAAKGSSQGYMDHCNLVWLALVRDGLGDIKDPRWGMRFRVWLSDLRQSWHRGLVPGREARFRTDAHKPVTRATRDRILREVRSMIHSQVLSLQPPVLTYDPTDGIDFMHRKKDQAMRDTFTVPELRKLVSDDMAAHPKFGPLFPLVALCAYTGWRPVECAYTRWEWIDRNAQVIRLREVSKDLLKGGERVGLKTGERVSPLEPELADAIDRNARPFGWIIDDEYVRTNGSCIQRRIRKKKVAPAWTKAFRRYAAAAGVDLGRRTLYSLRHTFISIKLAAGITENMVMGIVGHRNISTTLGYANYRTLFIQECQDWGNRLYLREEPPKADAKPAQQSRQR